MRRAEIPPGAAEPEIGPLAAIIAAHNEAAALSTVLASLRTATPSPDSIVVVADNCSDATASLARAAGAVVYERADGEGGKGAALSWLFTQHATALMPFSHVVIFDADSTVHPAFFGVVRRAFADGAQAVQGFVQPVGEGGSTAATLAAYSEVLSQVADDALRARLGWPVRLRGTGMAFQTGLLREMLPCMRTRAEDIELSLLSAARGVRVIFAPEAVVYDPKPTSAALVSRQRARWLQGQAEVWRNYWRIVLRLAGRGPAMWWLLHTLLVRPRTLVLALECAALALSLWLPVQWWVRVLLAGLILVDLLYYVLGLWLVPPAARRRYARALLRTPVYLWVWGASLLVALRTRVGWLSVRH